MAQNRSKLGGILDRATTALQKLGQEIVFSSTSADTFEAGRGFDEDRNSNLSVSSDHSETSENATGKGSTFSKARDGFINSLQSVAERRDPLMLDAAMKNLYLDTDILERKCMLSAYGGENGFFEDYEGDSDEDCDENVSGQNDMGGKLRPSVIKTPESVVDGLSEVFFEKDFDPVFGVIKEVATWGDGDISERFMAKIEETDTDKDMVLSRLATMVEANYADLMNCINHVQAIDVDLERAGLQITSSRRLISLSTDRLSSSSTKITSFSTRKEKLLLLMDMAKSLQVINRIHQSMLGNIVTGDLGRAAECAYNVLDSLRNHFYDQFFALDDTATRVQKSVYLIRQKADRALMRLSCRKFASSEYSNIIKAYLMLDQMAESLGVEVHVSSPERPNTPVILLDSFGCLEGLANRIFRFQIEDMDACLRTAVLEFIYASQHQRGLLEKKQRGTQYSVGKDMVDFDELQLSDLYQKVSENMLVPCVIRSCELLADVVHTHYLITQWHRTPFDARNEDSSHLHRCIIDLNDILDREVFDDEGDEEMDEDHDDDDGLLLESDTETPLEKNSLSQVNDLSLNLDSICTDSPHAVSTNLAEEGLQSILSPSRTEHVSEDSKSSSFLSPRTTSSWTPKSRSISLNTHLKDETRTAIVQAFESNFNGNVTRCVHSPKSEEDDARLRRLQGVRLTLAYQSLAQSRIHLWDELLKALVGALDFIEVSSAISLDDFLKMTWAINLIIKLGREFCDSDCTELKVCIEKKTIAYFKTLHSESFQVLRQMIDAETWDSVPMNLGELGGIIGIIRKSIPKRTDIPSLNQKSLMGNSLNLSPNRWALVSESIGDDVLSTTNSILMSFCDQGNPLRIASGTNHHNIDFEDDDSEDDEEEEDDDENQGRTSEDCAESKFMSALLAEPEGGITRRREEINKAMVVTQSSLNGLARSAARYLQTMHLMPLIAEDIFRSLCQLFDFYICQVFFGFVSTEERSKFWSRGAKVTSPSPDQSRDYEDVQLFLERALADTVFCTENILPTVHIAGFEHAECLHSQVSANGIVTVSTLLKEVGVIGESEQRNFFGMNARIVAAESCCFASKVMLELKSKFEKLLPVCSISSCEKYITTIQTVTSQLRSLIYRSMCPLILNAQHVHAQIDGGGWDTKKARILVSSWVVHLTEACKEVSPTF